MSEQQQFSIPHEVSRVTETRQTAGHEAYLVGGCVRDLLLGKQPKDWDVTTNANPEEIQSLFDETYYNNKFGTVGVVNEDVEDETLKVIEVTPYRTETGYSDSRRPDEVSFSKNLSDDLMRRDFTVNALALDVQTLEIIDLYKGREDLKDKILRAVGDPHERFDEDALRILRAIRLAAELGFAIEQGTFEAIAANVDNLKNISKERIRDEFIRIIMSKQPMEALLHMKQLDMLHYVIPELEQTIDVEQNKSHVFTVFEHLLRSLQHAADKEYSLEIRLAALYHDISKPETRRFSRETEDYTFYGHEVVGAKVTKKSLQNLKFSVKVTEKVVKLVRWHMFFSDPDEITLSAVRRMIVNVGEDDIWDLMNVRICDRIGMGRPKEQPFRYRKYKAMIDEALRDPVSVGMLKINGSDLMNLTDEAPGPKIGYVLHALLEEVLDDPARNTAEYLTERAKELLTLPADELEKIGEKGKQRREEADEAEIAKIRAKHSVS